MEDKDFEDLGMTQTMATLIADHLEEYMDNMQLFILEGRSQKDIDHAEKKVRKAIKNLRKGKYSKVFDYDRLAEYFEGEDDGLR